MRAYLAILASLLAPLAHGCTRRGEPAAAVITGRIRAAAPESLITAAELAPGDWLELRIFGPYTAPEEIDRRLGFSWAAPAKASVEASDTSNLFVFSRGRVVVAHAEVSRGAVDLCHGLGATPGLRFPRSATFRVAVEGGGERRVLCPDERLAPDVTVRRIAAGVWEHVTHGGAGGKIPANGLLVETATAAVLIDTTWSSSQAETLLRFSEQRLNLPVTDAIVTHAHEDRIGGAGAVLARGGRVHALLATIDRARELGHPVPDTPAGDGVVLIIGGETLQVLYPGHGHSIDNSTVYLPRLDILFGGCAVKGRGATDLGNIADANLRSWLNAVRQLEGNYPQVKLVIPGHGPSGGPELLSNTAALLEAAVAKLPPLEELP